MAFSFQELDELFGHVTPTANIMPAEQEMKDGTDWLTAENYNSYNHMVHSIVHSIIVSSEELNTHTRGYDS